MMIRKIDLERARGRWPEALRALAEIGSAGPFRDAEVLGLSDDGEIRVRPSEKNAEWFAIPDRGAALAERARRCGVIVEVIG